MYLIFRNLSDVTDFVQMGHICSTNFAGMLIEVDNNLSSYINYVTSSEWSVTTQYCHLHID